MVLVDVSPYEDLDGIRFEPTPLMQKDTVFLSLIVRGKANLYFLKDEFAKDHFFIQKGKNPIEELINYRYYTKDGQYGGRTMKKNKKYLGQLVYYFNDYPGYSTRISGTEYNMQSIKKLFTLYNQRWKDNKSNYVRETKKIETKFSIGIGMSSTNLKVSNLSSIPYWNKDFPISNNFTFGGTLNFIFPRDRKKLSAFVDFYIKSFNFQIQYVETIYADYYTEYEINYGKTYLKTGLGLRYNLIDKKLKPSIFGGISFSKALVSTSYTKTHKVFYNTITDDEKPYAYSGENNRELGGFVGVGITYKKFTLNLGYQYGWVSAVNEIGVVTHTFSSILCYMF